MALDVDALCVVPSFVFCFLLMCYLALLSLLCLLLFAVFAFHDKFYPVSHPSVHLCLRNFSLSRLPDGVKSCFYFSPF